MFLLLQLKFHNYLIVFCVLVLIHEICMAQSDNDTLENNHLFLVIPVFLTCRENGGAMCQCVRALRKGNGDWGGVMRNHNFGKMHALYGK